MKDIKEYLNEEFIKESFLTRRKMKIQDVPNDILAIGHLNIVIHNSKNDYTLSWHGFSPFDDNFISKTNYGMYIVQGFISHYLLFKCDKREFSEYLQENLGPKPDVKLIDRLRGNDKHAIYLDELRRYRSNKRKLEEEIALSNFIEGPKRDVYDKILSRCNIYNDQKLEVKLCTRDTVTECMFR